MEWTFQLSTRPEPGGRADAVRNRRLALDAATALLAGPSTPLTVEAIARKAGLGVATVVRAFGGKEALLDAAISGLLEPVVQRARDLLAQTTPYQALCTYLPELIAFQAAHYAVGASLEDLNLPATTALTAGLTAAVEDMIAGARQDGMIRTDLEPAVVTTLIIQTAHAIARARSWSQELTDAYLTVLLDGLRPLP